MARDVLAIAIASVDFYAPEPVQKTNPYYPYSKPAEEPAQLERAKMYVKASLQLGRDDIFSTVVDKLVDISEQVSSDIVTRRVQGVLFPIISYAEELSHALLGGASPRSLPKLSTSTNSLYVKAAFANPSRILVTDVASLVKAMIASERSDGLFTW